MQLTSPAPPTRKALQRPSSTSREQKTHSQRYRQDEKAEGWAMHQMKEQGKTPEKQLNEVEIGNLPEKEFRIMIVQVIQVLRKRMEAKIEKTQEMFNKDLEELTNKQR